jgi:spore germination protein GerM
MVKRILVSLFLLVALAELYVARSNPKPAAPKPQRIKIYFYHEPGEYIDLSPVTRVIRSNSPARTAIEALLAGPTAAERQKGFD